VAVQSSESRPLDPDSSGETAAHGTCASDLGITGIRRTRAAFRVWHISCASLSALPVRAVGGRGNHLSKHQPKLIDDSESCEARKMSDPERVLTPSGYERLMAELDYLRTVRRHEVAERLKAAREVGAWDSPEHLSAREEQAFVEGRIATLERLLAQAEVVEVPAVTAWPSVEVGSTVLLRDETGEEEQYTIVGAMEAEPGAGRISNQSPVGRALLGRRPGETVEVETPMGKRKLTIVAIS